MNQFENITEYFETNFDLDRISELPITDKFTLVHYIKLVHKASLVAKDQGIAEITKSEIYESDKTFYLFLSLISAGLSDSVISEVVELYAFNYEDSDIFYAKTVILGAGTLMIQKGTDSHSVISYLMTLLGDAFFKDNFALLFADKDKLVLDNEREITIKYTDFDLTFRKLKYELLAILKIRRESGYERARDIIMNHFDNKQLTLYYILLDVKDEHISAYIYKKLMSNGTKMDRFLLTACRAITQDCAILETHYLLNGIIGKYTRFNKPYQEVIEEIEMREKEILSRL